MVDPGGAYLPTSHGRHCRLTPSARLPAGQGWHALSEKEAFSTAPGGQAKHTSERGSDRGVAEGQATHCSALSRNVPAPQGAHAAAPDAGIA